MGLCSLPEVWFEAKKDLCQHAEAARTAIVIALTLQQATVDHAAEGDSDTHRQVWLSLVGSLLLSLGSWCTQSSVCALQESVSPVLCKFLCLYGGVNGDLLQEGLCHTQVYCTQSPCLCSSILLTHTITGDTQNMSQI